MNIFVNGRELKEYLEINVNISMGKIGGSFVFSSNREDAAQVGDSVRIDGIITGFVLKKARETSKENGSVYTFSGVDCLAFLSNCQLPRYKTYRNVSFKHIADEMIRGLRNASDFKVVEIGGGGVSEFQINAGESIGTTLGRLSAHTGRFIYARADGVIEIASAGHRGENRVGENVTKVSEETNIEDLASDISGRTHYVPELSLRYEVSRKVEEFPARLHIPNFLTGGYNIDEISRIVRRRHEEIVIKMTSLKIALKGIIKEYAVNSRTLFDGKYYNLKEIEFRKNKKDGSTTSLTLGGLPL